MSTLKRPVQPMPAFVQDALQDAGALELYATRPAYQRNDYLWWINSAKRDVTKQKRLRQMLDELCAGFGYMGMDWHPKK